MDGNGRWATAADRTEGHKAGFFRIEVVTTSVRLGLDVVGLRQKTGSALSVS